MDALARLARKRLFTDARGVRAMPRQDLVLVIAEAHIAEARLSVGTGRLYSYVRGRWDGLRTTDLDEVHVRPGGLSGALAWATRVTRPIQYIRDLRGVQRVLDREIFVGLDAADDLNDGELRALVSRVAAYDQEIWVAFRRFHAVAHLRLRRMVRADQQRRRRRARTRSSFQDLVREVATGAA